MIEADGLSEIEALREVVDDAVIDTVGVSDCVREPVPVPDGVSVTVALPLAEGVLDGGGDSDAVPLADAPSESVVVGVPLAVRDRLCVEE